MELEKLNTVLLKQFKKKVENRIKKEKELKMYSQANI